MGAARRSDWRLGLPPPFEPCMRFSRTRLTDIVTDLADTALIKSLCSFPCIDEVQVLPHVAGSPDLGVVRPAPTAAGPPKPLPGIAGYRPGIASHPPAADGAETALPSSQDDHPHVQRPIRRRVPQRPLLDQERFPWPSPSHNRLGTLSFPPTAGRFNDARSGFTHVADRAVHPPRFAPGLSTTHGGFATEDPGISPDRTHTSGPS